MLKKTENNQLLIAELQRKQSQITNSEPLPLPSSLPPSDLPPTLTDGIILGADGKKLLVTLENKYKEFFKVGNDLSEKVAGLPDIIEGILSNLDPSIVSRMPDQGLAFTLFMQEIIQSTQYLATLSDPVPAVTSKITDLSSMTLLDIRETFFELKKGLVDSNFNTVFKSRAIQCVLLTLALGKLQKSRDMLNKVDDNLFSYLVNLLISTVQRLAQLKLFAQDAKAIFEKLQSFNNLTDLDKTIIADTITLLEELICRSQLIGTITDRIIETTNLVAMDTVENRFSDTAIQQLTFFKTLVSTYVQLTMEAEFTKEFASQITEQLNLELATHLPLKSAKLYHKICQLIVNTAPCQTTDMLKAPFKKAMCAIHEDTRLDDEGKLTQMKQCIHNHLTHSKSLDTSWFFPRQPSDLEIKLELILKTEMHDSTNVPKFG